MGPSKKYSKILQTKAGLILFSEAIITRHIFLEVQRCKNKAKKENLMNNE
jgi:hypothetical protein